MWTFEGKFGTLERVIEPHFAAAHRGAANTNYTPNHYHERTRVMADFDSTPKKICSKCGVEKPATPEFFYRDSKNKSGFYARCKDCQRELNREYEARPEVRAKRADFRKTPKYKEWFQRPENIEKQKQHQARHLAKLKTPEYRAKDRESDRLTPPEERHGFVYLIRAENGIYKIGRATNPAQRIRHIETVSPIPIEIICIIETDDRMELECVLHTQFADKRLHGEWFNLSPKDVEYIKGLTS